MLPLNTSSSTMANNLSMFSTVNFMWTERWPSSVRTSTCQSEPGYSTTSVSGNWAKRTTLPGDRPFVGLGLASRSMSQSSPSSRDASWSSGGASAKGTAPTSPARTARSCCSTTKLRLFIKVSKTSVLERGLPCKPRPVRNRDNEALSFVNATKALPSADIRRPVISSGCSNFPPRRRFSVARKPNSVLVAGPAIATREGKGGRDRATETNTDCMSQHESATTARDLWIHASDNTTQTRWMTAMKHRPVSAHGKAFPQTWGIAMVPQGLPTHWGIPIHELAFPQIRLHQYMPMQSHTFGGSKYILEHLVCC